MAMRDSSFAMLRTGRRGDLLRMTVPTGFSAAWTAVGKRQWLTLQPAPAGARVAYRDRLFLPPLPGLVSCSTTSSHASRHGPHSAAAPRLASARFFPHGMLWPTNKNARIRKSNPRTRTAPRLLFVQTLARFAVTAGMPYRNLVTRVWERKLRLASTTHC